MRSRAEDILQERRLNNRIRQDERIKEVYDKLPRIKEIDRKTRLINIDMVSDLLEGKDISQSRKKIQSLAEEKKGLLEQAGFSPDYMELKYHCDKCKDQGYVDGHMCDCKRQLKVEELYNLSEINDRIEKENFSTFNLNLFRRQRMDREPVSPYERMAEIRDLMESLSQNFDEDFPNLYFYGTVGTGKTFMINCMAKELMDDGVMVIYQTASQLIDFLSSYQFMYAEEKLKNKEKADMLKTCDLLIIDDLGTEFKTEIVKSILFDVINARIVQDKPTIISSNLSPQELRDVYDDRIYSRILGEYTAVKFYGNDLRIGGW